jgi:SAM-dependent methyltransferase
MKIILGCGQEDRGGEGIGLDIVDFKWNRVWDATRDPIPFGDGEIDFIEAHNFLEHIERRYWRHLLNECHRVLKPNGVMEIITPDAAKGMELAMADITHVSFVVKGTITQYLTGRRPRNASYGFHPWIVIECRNYDEKEPGDIFARIRPNK